MAEALIWNPFDEQFMADPYPTYRWLQTHDPVSDPGIGALVVTRYSDVETVLRDRTVTANNQSEEDTGPHTAAAARPAIVHPDGGRQAP